MRSNSGRVKSSSKMLAESQKKFIDVLNAWTLLSFKQMLAWNNLAKTIYKTDSIGNIFPYSGRDIFQKFNRNLVESDEDIILDPPVNLKVQNFKSFSVVITQNGNYIKDMILFIKSNIASNTKIKLFASPPARMGVSNIKPNTLRKIGYLDSSFISGSSIKQMYIEYFNNPKAKFFRIRFCIIPLNKKAGTTGAQLDYIATSEV